MKQCTRCKVNKNETEFSTHPLYADKLLSQCISCNGKQKTYRKKNIKKDQHKQKIYYNKNKEKIIGVRYLRFNTLEGRLKRLLSTIKNRNENYDLDIEYLLNMYKQQEGKCALTGIKMLYKNDSNRRTHPFMISVDRIDPKLGYIKGNVRLLTVAANFALNEWGEEVFKIVCRAYLNQTSK